MLIRKDNGEVLIGQPYIEGAHVKAKVIQHIKGPKVIIFKKKPKKHYKKKFGHRQPLTELKITEISYLK
jgi:large subunit ribosomal protein L21